MSLWYKFFILVFRSTPTEGLRIFDGKWTSAKLLNIETSCIVTDLTAKVCSTCVYESENAAEGVYTFPLNNVAFYSFEAEIGDRKIVAECRPRGEVTMFFFF